MITDEELLRTVATGDRAERDSAFTQLVDRHRDRVWGICYRYFRDPVDAEDAAQETFVTVLRRSGTFRGEAKASTWLYRVTVNTCHDIARMRSRRPQTPVEDIGRVADAAGHHVDETLDALEVTDALREALAALDEETRGLLLLCTVEGQAYADVAATYGIAVGTVKSRVFRARARLAELLGPMLSEDEQDEPGAVAPRAGTGRPDSAPPPARGPPSS